MYFGMILIKLMNRINIKKAYNFQAKKYQELIEPFNGVPEILVLSDNTGLNWLEKLYGRKPLNEFSVPLSLSYKNGNRGPNPSDDDKFISVFS